LHDVVRAFDVALIHLVGVFGPEAVVGGAVINDAAALNRFSEGIEIAQVAGDEFNWEVLKVIATTGGPYEAVDLFAAFEEDANEM